MPERKRASEKKTHIRVGNVSNISGNVNVAGGNITTHQTVMGLSASEIKQLLDELSIAIKCACILKTS
ncbi:MAG: hypothetical protein L0287_19370 [Anaerolineae bacterium]|nr:hypothetical protein [Anaerolineae bacterium]